MTAPAKNETAVSSLVSFPVWGSRNGRARRETLAETSDDSASEIEVVAADDVNEAPDVGVHMEDILVLMEVCPVADVEPGGTQLAGKDGDGEAVGDWDDEGHGLEEGGAEGKQSLTEPERVRRLVVAEAVKEHTGPVPGT